MKAKDFLELDFSPWETDFNENYWNKGEDSLNLSSDSTDVTVSIRDDGSDLVIEWASENDGDCILVVNSDSGQSVNEVYQLIKEQLDSF
jgi:hypothetical protein